MALTEVSGKPAPANFKSPKVGKLILLLFYFNSMSSTFIQDRLSCSTTQSLSLSITHICNTFTFTFYHVANFTFCNTLTSTIYHTNTSTFYPTITFTFYCLTIFTFYHTITFTFNHINSQMGSELESYTLEWVVTSSSPVTKFRVEWKIVGKGNQWQSEVAEVKKLLVVRQSLNSMLSK